MPHLVPKSEWTGIKLWFEANSSSLLGKIKLTVAFTMNLCGLKKNQFICSQICRSGIRTVPEVGRSSAGITWAPCRQRHLCVGRALHSLDCHGGSKLLLLLEPLVKARHRFKNRFKGWKNRLYFWMGIATSHFSRDTYVKMVGRV